MALGNPVLGIILGNKQPWPGTPKFRVTATFQQHADAGRARGIDIGNGRCGDPVLAMADGTVSFSGKLGLSLVVRIDHPQLGRLHQTAYAHLSSSVVKVGQVVRRGQRIGALGKTGATACHLHGGYTISGVEQDWWPWLEQNIEEPSVADVTITLFVDGPHSMTIPKGGTVTGYDKHKLVKTQTFSTGSSFPSDGSAFLEQPPGTSGPHGTFYRCTAGTFIGLYVPVTQVSDAGPITPPTTYTQAQLDKAEADAARKVADAAVDQALDYQ